MKKLGAWSFQGASARWHSWDVGPPTLGNYPPLQEFVWLDESTASEAFRDCRLEQSLDRFETGLGALSGRPATRRHSRSCFSRC